MLVFNSYVSINCAPLRLYELRGVECVTSNLTIHGHVRSSVLLQLGLSVYDFLLVSNNNHMSVSHRLDARNPHPATNGNMAHLVHCIIKQEAQGLGALLD